jgi:YD repeat-containing protein
MTTNMVATMVTNAAIRQVQAPQAIADVPVPPTFNGYVINLYYPTNIVGTNLDGTFQFSVPPFITWLVTNPAPATINQLQISETNYAYGSLKQWTYTYDPNSGAWSVQDLAGVQENMIITNINSTAYQIINTWQYSGGPVVQQTKTTYTNFSWGKAPIQIAVGSDSAPQTTTYTYYDPSPFGSGSPVPVNTVIHPDGSWEYYASYDPSGNPLIVYSSYGDAAVDDTSNGRQTVYVYDPGSAGVSDSGDNGTANPNVPRQTITYVQGQEISCSYTVFPSVSERLDIQCTASYPNDQWNSAGNLVTTNLFYTSGPNQFALQAVIRPDGTATVYNYITNGICQTNITVTGQPDSTLTNIVDGVSNVTVLNSAGYNVSVATYDVASHFPLSEDTYGYFDNYGRPQQVIHLDGTTETMNYACCGLDNTTDRDGVYTQYLYDPAKRQIGYARYVDGANSITYTNVLDAAGRVLKSVRIGSDNSSITRSQSTYDQAGELINQTNALGGGTTYTRTNDPNTGGLIRTTIYPNGGAVTNFYYADGSLKETIGTAVHGKGYGYGYGTDTNGNACTYSVETNLNSNGSLSSEWTQTYTDMAGRTTETLYADGHCSQSFYNSQGQLWKQIDPDGIVTLYQYNAKGEQTCKAVAMNQSETSINFSSDRVTGTTNVVTTDHGANVRFIGTYIWTANNNSSSTLVSTIETSTSGLTNWQTQYRDTSTAVTTTNQTSYSGTSRTTITIAPDNSYTISTYSYGRLVSSTRYDSGYNPIASTSYSYDSHGRQSTATDARNGATTYGYNNADLVTNVITPNPGTLGGSPETTTTSYNMMLQPTGVVQPDGTSVTTVYLLTGELGLQYGSRTYPVGYSYDYAGRMKTMTNWSNYSGGTGTRVTTWNYDGYRGFLTSKTYDNSTPGPSYVYTAAGRLASRTWARGITTTYGYNIAGDLATVVYSDTTPDVTNTYDRLGHPIQISGTNSTESLAYNLANELLSESYSGGLLNGLSVTNAYDSFLRRTAVALSNQPSTLIQFGYDNASRLLLVTNGLSTATYTYLANSPLVGQITFKSNSVTSMTTGKTYDYLNRLTGISSVGTASPISFNYNDNSANQRTRNALADGSYWIYQYDSLGQVTSGCKYWSDGTPVAGQQFDYTFDDIGNRKQTLSGGDQSGGGRPPAA